MIFQSHNMYSNYHECKNNHYPSILFEQIYCIVNSMCFNFRHSFYKNKYSDFSLENKYVI